MASVPGNPFFGDWGDAPCAQPPAERVAPPVGELCFACGEPIQPHDVGQIMPNWRDVWTFEPIHRDCLLELILPDFAQDSEVDS